mmetsp:Transcript_1205/g.2139  ORF Transcript_1205/g.2139 Transcript_1205/m.2139 type:complete len:293 (+) Transcript_1205:87-965(+)|eukprot:CAMPEP_0183721428 /NCGR_PEP_ID=MMETSP0737-20130205/13709_1 /TAXON_ID=385413 /ORGANISM="Thalassiosira miniscula, Strain CCMP1093" /LENGTH=292 /DNA_ID=CAMNT_0025951435 /DNA_START=61 /DNA_END=939 /DNA_ORIENTATION=+
MAMRTILSIGLAALAATTSSVSAETTVAILEFGPGGSVHRTTSSSTESSAAAVSSLWNALHRPSSKRSSRQHAGMSVVPDLFSKADAGIVIGLQGGSLESMSTVASLLDAEEIADNVVGHIHVPGQAAEQLMKSASSKDLDAVSKDDISRRLQSAAKTAANGDVKGIDAVSLAVNNDDVASVADEELGRMLKTLRKQAAANGKTVVVHLVADSTRRRLNEDEDKEGEGENQNNNNNAYSNEKTMYEIQTFNLYLWTAVGLVVIVYMVIGAFIDMPLMPDTLLFGETAKMGSD